VGGLVPIDAVFGGVSCAGAFSVPKVWRITLLYSLIVPAVRTKPRQRKTNRTQEFNFSGDYPKCGGTKFVTLPLVSAPDCFIQDGVGHVFDLVM